MGGSFRGLSTTMTVASEAEHPFDVVIAVRNNTATPIAIDGNRPVSSFAPPKVVDTTACTLHERLTNSAGRVVVNSAPCGEWIGAMTQTGWLPPGAAVTARVEIEGKDESVGGGLCRTGPWRASLSVETQIGVVRFAEFPFVVPTVYCSDSPPASVIQWPGSSTAGVRLGVMLHAANGDEPAEVPFAIPSLVKGLSSADSALIRRARCCGPTISAFHAGATIVADLYLDNVTDDSIRLRMGPGAVRVTVEHSPQVDTNGVAPSGAEPDAPLRDVVVPPHTQMHLGSAPVSEMYRLAPGDYSIEFGLRTLMGPAARANVPQPSGSPSPSSCHWQGQATCQAEYDAAKAGVRIRILP